MVRKLNESLRPQVEEKELVLILKTLNESDNKKLPPQFVTRAGRRKLGWKPGKDLWASSSKGRASAGMRASAIGKAGFPMGRGVWHEADLDYAGGRRGPKRNRLFQRWTEKDHGRSLHDLQGGTPMPVEAIHEYKLPGKSIRSLDRFYDEIASCSTSRITSVGTWMPCGTSLPRILKDRWN